MTLYLHCVLTLYRHCVLTLYRHCALILYRHCVLAAELAFNICFSLEMALRVLAVGSLVAYIKRPWNQFDAVSLPVVQDLGTKDHITCWA